MSRQKLLAVTMTTLMVLSMFSGTVLLSSTTATAANTSTSKFEVTDAGNAGGDLYVTVQASSGESAKDFRFLYDDRDGGGTLGPVELDGSNGAFLGAKYGAPGSLGDSYSAGTLISDGTRVTFFFDSSSTDYDYESDQFRINATAYDKTYATADTGNRSVYTGNYHAFALEDAAGNSLRNAPALVYDADTNSTLGTIFVTDTPPSFDCRGVEIDGQCTNPDTGSAAPLTGRQGTFQGPISIEAFDLSTANGSQKVTPSTTGTTTLRTDTPTAPTFLRLSSLTRGGSTPVAETLTITNASSGNVVYRAANFSQGSGAPVFLRPNTEYTVTLQNSSTFGTETRSLTLPTKGLSSVNLRVATTNVAASQVTGQIVNESGAPVEGAVVIAQPEYASGSRIDVYNSTTTDSDGLFTMRLPETSQLSSDFGFRIIGTDTSGGTPIYYPTNDANDGDGYVVQSGKTVIPAMTLREGGRVAIDVTSSKSKLPIGFGLTSLSQVSTAYPDTERTASSNSFSTFSFGQRPKSAGVSLMSPTTGPQTQVTYNVWGQSAQRPQWVCANQPSVSQGSTTSSTCTLGQAGYLNVSVTTYGSIVESSNANAENVEDIGFFFQNELLVRDASTGEVVTYLGPDGIQQSFLGTNGSSETVQVPVPAGDYTVQLRPAYEFARTTTVNDSASVTVTADSETAVALDRGAAFGIRPSFERSQRSFNRGADNTVAIRVSDPATGKQLTGSTISASARLLYPNGTTATASVPLSYNSTDGTFDTTTFKPSALGVDAGRYSLAVRATYADGQRTYNTTRARPVQVSGFRTAVKLGSRTVAPGDSVIGQIYAYDTTTDPDTAIDASSASQTTITVYNENGQQVSQVTPASGFTGGQGSFSLAMPSDPGQYRVSVRVESDSGSQGIAERWVRVSTVDLSVETDQGTYSPTDAVTVSVEADDATDGSAITNASLTLRINGQRVTGATDGNGEATFTLDPAVYGTGGQWERGHPVSVTLAHDTGNSVVRKTAGTGFEVQAFAARARPTTESFEASESATLEVQVPTTVSVDTVAVTTLDGETVQIGGDPDSSGVVTNPAAGIYRVDLGQRPVGDHVATVTVDSATQGTQTARTQFAVKQYALSASLDKRSYEAGETIAVDVSVRNPDGSVASGTTVGATLNTTDPVRAVDSATGTTDSSGDATLSLSSSQSGFHFVKVAVGQQTRYVGLSVSSVSARLENSSGDPVSTYNAEPGTTQTIYVNATKSDGTAVADGSTVTASISAYGERVELGSADTTGGTASISFDVPESVPAREYPLLVDVTTTGSGTGTTTGMLNVTGANARQVTVTTNETAYAPGGTVRFEATVTTGDGSPVANEQVDLVVASEGTADRRIATVTTDSDGKAVYDYAVPSSASNGRYVVLAALNDTTSIRDYSGYRVRSLDVSVVAEDGPFEPGDTVTLTVEAVDSATGDAVDATDGTVTLLLPGSNVETTIDTTGSAPYETSVTLPNDGSITGTRSLSVTVQQDRATDSDSTLINVRDSSESANFTVDQPITAGQSTTVTVNGTVDATGVLTAYSPGAGTVAYNDSVSVASSGETTTEMTIDSPGTHIVRLSVPGVGAITKVVDVEAAGGKPTVWTGTGTSANATQFDSTEDIYLKTNTSGMTATVISENATYTVELDQQSGGTYYGVLSTNRSAGIYLVRLDSEQATSVNDTIIEVSG